jgi:hypothetical protein
MRTIEHDFPVALNHVGKTPSFAGLDVFEDFDTLRILPYFSWHLTSSFAGERKISRVRKLGQMRNRLTETKATEFLSTGGTTGCQEAIENKGGIFQGSVLTNGTTFPTVEQLSVKP